MAWLAAALAGFTLATGAAVLAPRRAQPKMVFVKTHSTGSSTLTGILHRYCDVHGARCFVSPEGVSAATTYDRAQLEAVVDQFPAQLDIWPNHVVFEPDVFDEMIPGSQKISLFRSPLNRTMSAFRHSPASVIIDHLDSLVADRGMPTALPCGGNIAGIRMSDQVRLEDFDKLDLVLLTEQYDLSLILLRRRMSWTTRDIVYARLKDYSDDEDRVAAAAEVEAFLTQADILTQAAQDLLDYCVRGDEAAIYSMAEQRFEEQLEALAPAERKSVNAEVLHFQGVLAEVSSCCQKHPQDSFCSSLQVDNIEWTSQARLSLRGEVSGDCASVVTDYSGP
mmetsp:Transcript_24247/g.53861  ORF Transcript_24247/g.53861 Transcript_24247/m.53861 type:complete len:336 (-) Transcript_24247:45-1052(-)